MFISQILGVVLVLGISIPIIYYLNSEFLVSTESVLMQIIKIFICHISVVFFIAMIYYLPIVYFDEIRNIGWLGCFIGIIGVALLVKMVKRFSREKEIKIFKIVLVASVSIVSGALISVPLLTLTCSSCKELYTNQLNNVRVLIPFILLGYALTIGVTMLIMIRNIKHEKIKIQSGQNIKVLIKLILISVFAFSCVYYSFYLVDMATKYIEPQGRILNFNYPEFSESYQRFPSCLLGYFQSAYFSIVTFSTVGFGEISPNSIITQAIVSLEIITAFSNATFSNATFGVALLMENDKQKKHPSDL